MGDKPVKDQQGDHAASGSGTPGEIAGGAFAEAAETLKKAIRGRVEDVDRGDTGQLTPPVTPRRRRR